MRCLRTKDTECIKSFREIIACITTERKGRANYPDDVETLSEACVELTNHVPNSCQFQKQFEAHSQQRFSFFFFFCGMKETEYSIFHILEISVFEHAQVSV